MRITQEVDYALRIVSFLGCHDKIIEAKVIAETTKVPLRFALKILRKLVVDGIVKSYKGVNGGYLLLLPPNEITLRKIVELIDGPLLISRCLEMEFSCSQNGNEKKGCVYHQIFQKINTMIAEKLDRIHLDEILDDSICTQDIVDRLDD